MKVQTTHQVSAASIVKSGWGNKICTPDTFVNLSSYSKFIIFMKWVIYKDSLCRIITWYKSKRKAMNRNWSNQKANPGIKTAISLLPW